MSIGVARILIVGAVVLCGLSGCSTSGKVGDSASLTAATPEAANTTSTGTTGAGANATGDAADATGTVNVQPAEPGPAGEPVEPLSKPGLLGDDPSDDIQLGKKYFRATKYGLAEQYFRRAAATHPKDAEAWVGLAASYDRLHRFDLADRAYAQAIRLIGPTAEILNDQGFSYMLRGDYARAHRKFVEAQLKDPTNPYVQANLRLLEDSLRDRKAVQ